MDINWLPIFGSKIGFKRAEKEIPQVVKELGLKYHQSETTDTLGIIEGCYKGYRLEVILKEQNIRIYFKKGTYQNLYLSTKKSKRRVSSSSKSVNKSFNKYFKEQNLTSKFKKKIDTDSEVNKSFKNLILMRIDDFFVCDQYVNLRHSNPGFARNYGRDFNNPHTTGYMITDYVYIPASYIRKVIPLLVTWLDLLEK